jgi:hypothetical protein
MCPPRSPITCEVVLVLSPALRDGARNRNRAVERAASKEVDYDYEHEHEHGKLEIPIMIHSFENLRLEEITPIQDHTRRTSGSSVLLPGLLPFLDRPS